MIPTTSILEFPSLKKSRRYGAKVRTGCKTCKARRVKCDESRPNCSRCTSAGRECDGYVPDKRPQSHFPTQGQFALVRPSEPIYAGSENSVRYLEFYHQCAGPILSSKWDNEFWCCTALKMAQSESTVRHALIALGYLHKAEPGSLKHARSSFTGRQPRTLLFHYNKAIRCLIERMAEPSYVPEVGLVTCLLFVCIEFLRGNYLTGFAHLLNGLKMISEWQDHRLNGSLSHPPSLQSSQTAQRRISVGTTVMDNHLIPLFIRAIASALSYGVNVEQVFNIPNPQPQRLQKRLFSTVLEAQSCSHELRNATILFSRSMAQRLLLREPITTENHQCQTRLLECHRLWMRDLETLEYEQSLSRDDEILASSLKVAYYTTYIMLACGLDVLQSPYDAHISNFKALIHHAKIVIASMNLGFSNNSFSAVPSTSPPSAYGGVIESASPPTLSLSVAANFTFEISLLPCLDFTATRCRCPTTRREAVSLLALKPPREGLWDPEQLVAVSNRVIEIEERELDPNTGWPVENTRLWCAIIDGNMDRNGGFWVTFAHAKWVLGGHALTDRGGRRRLDAQWEEWFVL